MTLLEIEAFLAVVKWGTLSGAAQKLFITQPALSRRIQAMEKELGYSLFLRQKGHREIQLTEQGAEFYHIAWKWQKLWSETHLIAKKNKTRETLAIAAVDSVNHHMLPALFPQLIERGYLLRLYNAFSEDTYQYMENGIYDLALITAQDYTRKLPKETLLTPIYSEGFVVASASPLPTEKGRIACKDLAERKEIYTSWNKEFKAWHSDHFNEMADPLVILEHAALTPYFLKDDAWTFCPYTTGEWLKRQGAHVYRLLPEDTPPSQIVYAVHNPKRKPDAFHTFLTLLLQQLKTYPPDQRACFL